MKKTKVFVLGASGMLGNAVFRLFSNSDGFAATGIIRSSRSLELLPPSLRKSVISNVDLESADNLLRLFEKHQPNVIINCVGLIKQHADANDPLVVLPINSLLPHRLAMLSSVTNARLVHISTDCVFSGAKGMYLESDFSDARDLYGRSKFLGEVDYPNAITLRTSIIGHELDGTQSLVNWFLSQKDSIKGFTRAIFSGLPTVEIARVIRDYVIPNAHLSGLYHVSADPISKYDLLKIIADVYKKTISIEPDESFIIDRSLDSSRFRKATGFKPRPWLDLVNSMRDFG